VYLLTHPFPPRPRGGPLSPLLPAAIALALLLAPIRAAGFDIGTLLPPLLRAARVGSVSVGLDGRLELRDVRWTGRVKGVRVEAAAPLVRLALGGHGATLPALELTVDLAPGEATAPESPAAPGAGPGPGLGDPAPAEPAARRGPIERALAAAERAARLLGPVDVTRAGVTVLRAGRPLARLEPLALRLEPQADGSLRAVVSGTLAGPTGAADGGAVDIEALRAADGRAALRAALRDVELAPPLADAPAGSGGPDAGPPSLVRGGRATLELDVAVPTDGPLAAHGRVLVRGLTLEHPAIAPAPVAFRRLSAEFRAAVERGERRVHLETSAGRLNEAAVDLVVDLARRPRGAWHVAARLALAEQPCAVLMDAVPDGLLGNLAAARWRGTAGFALTLALDTDELRKLRLDLEGDPDGCAPATLGRATDRALDRLSTPFRAPVADPSGATPPDLEVGPGTPGFVPYDEIPRHVRVAALATEDRRFFHHKGVSLRLIQGALRLDLSKGEYYYGGSTITQQLVKNLLLTRDKSLARKFQELVLAREVERRLTKERILELYLNCIEYGPGVFGLGAAARFYFDKEARGLGVLDGAFLMALKPSPRTGFLVFRRGRLNSRWQAKLRIVLQRMVELGGLDAAALEAQAPYQPDFVPYDPARHGAYPRR
jgi:hypothetical protein